MIGANEINRLAVMGRESLTGSKSHECVSALKCNDKMPLVALIKNQVLGVGGGLQRGFEMARFILDFRLGAAGGDLGWAEEWRNSAGLSGNQDLAPIQGCSLSHRSGFWSKTRIVCLGRWGAGQTDQRWVGVWGNADLKITLWGEGCAV